MEGYKVDEPQEIQIKNQQLRILIHTQEIQEFGAIKKKEDETCVSVCV